MKITTRVFVIAILSIGLVLMLGLLLLLSGARVRANLEAEVFVDHVVEEVFELNILTSEYVSSRSKSSEFRWESKHKALGAIIGTTAFDDHSRAEIWARVARNHRSANDIFAQIKDAPEREGLQARLLDQLTFRSQTIISNASALKRIIARDSGKSRKQAELISGVFIVLVTLLSIISAVATIRTVAIPVVKLHKGVEIIGEGDLDYRVDITSRDEIGALAAAFNQMTKNLKRITASRDDLNAEAAERKRAEQELRVANQQLGAANKELETFAYSVSHDLRAPLRGMDGFSQALLEDYGGKLEEQGRDYLNRVRAGAQRMGALIEDLLKLSRITRREMVRKQVDLSALAREIAADLKGSEPARDVVFSIGEGLAASGDMVLLRAALENLLGNAWKFTGKQAKAQIDVGAIDHEGGKAYFVRDNGAGFDMAYVDKLFGAFQRLHSSKEFTGTGIGLATVQRIVNRHGGRVWAEGEVGKGATFSFTLGA